MMKLKLIPLVLAGVTILPGCFEDKNKATEAVAQPPAVTKEDAVASVNGVYISKKTLEALEKQVAERSQGQSFPKEQLVDELIQRELLTQQAQQKNLDKTPEFVERLAEIKNALLSQADVQDYIKNNPVTDEEVKAEYDSRMGNLGSEYKASHILVKTEAEAKKIIAELEKGADFAALAKKYSIDPAGAKGGDLGWFTTDRMVAPFSEAVTALENGKFSKQPVQTQFGWHVILRQESRPVSAPPFDAVKEQIRPILQRHKVQTMLEGLRKTANVENLLPKEAAPEAKDEQAPAADSKPAEAAPAEASPAEQAPAAK